MYKSLIKSDNAILALIDEHMDVAVISISDLPHQNRIHYGLLTNSSSHSFFRVITINITNSDITINCYCDVITALSDSDIQENVRKHE